MTGHEIGSAVLRTAVTVRHELGPGLAQTVYTLNFGEAVIKTGIARCVNGL